VDANKIKHDHFYLIAWPARSEYGNGRALPRCNSHNRCAASIEHSCIVRDWMLHDGVLRVALFEERSG